MGIAVLASGMAVVRGKGGRKASEEWQHYTDDCNPKFETSSKCKYCPLNIEHKGELRKMRSHLKKCPGVRSVVLSLLLLTIIFSDVR
jgi:hypothetical protein